MTSWTYRTYLVGIMLLAGCLFFPSLGFLFLDWDDNLLLTNNPWVQAHSWPELWRVWNPYPVLQKHHPEYFPLRDLAYAVVHWIWGLHPRAYHGLNVALHLANLVLVAALATRILRSACGGLFTAFLFAVHPIHVEAVVWVSAFKELSMTFFVLLSCWCFVRYLEQRRIIQISLALLCAVSAAFCKHVGVLTPACWVVLLWCFPRTYWLTADLRHSPAPDTRLQSTEEEPTEMARSSRTMTSFFRRLFFATSYDSSDGKGASAGSQAALSAVTSQTSWLRREAWIWGPVVLGLGFALAFGLWSLQIGKSNLLIHDITHTARHYNPMILQPLVQWDNLSRLLFAWTLQPIYDPPIFRGWFTINYLLAVMVCVGVLGLGILAWTKRVYAVVLGLAWYGVGWMPFLTFQVGTQLTTDRYLYLPSFGFCVVLTWAWLQLAAKHRWTAWSLAGLIGVWYMVSTSLYLPMWHSPQTFWPGFVQRAPLQSHALAGMASLQMQQHNYPAAIRTNQLFLQHYTPHPDRMADLCVAYVLIGQPDKGLEVIKRGLQRFPNSARIQNAAGFVMVRGNRPDLAVPYFVRAVQLDARLFQAHLNLVRSLFHTKQPNAARRHAHALLRQPLPVTVRTQLLQLLHQEHPPQR